MSHLRRKYDLIDELPGYIDLRTSFPQIQSLNNLPFNPIISVVYIPYTINYLKINYSFFLLQLCLFTKIFHFITM